MVRAAWDLHRDEFCINYLLKAMRAEKKSDSGFKKDVYLDLAVELNARFTSHMEVEQIQTLMYNVSCLSCDSFQICAC